MKRPLCCLCAAYVVTVFIYLMLNPIAYDESLEDGGMVTLQGVVTWKEYKNDRLVVTLKNVSTGQNKIEGVMCYMDDASAEPELGSSIAVSGKVSCIDKARNYGAFDAARYYKLQGIDYRIYNASILAKTGVYSKYRETLYQLRRYLEGVYDRYLNEKDASIMKAMVLGNKSELDSDSKQLFQKSGIAHVFAISGLHITLIGMGLYKLLKKIRLPRILCCVVSVAVMIAYGDMVGMSSSACRAVVMFALRLAATLFRRTYDMLTALSLAAVLILVEQPLYLYHSGFLLSFGAIIGVGMLSEVVELPKHLDLGIFIVHFPIMLCVYYEFPVYSFLLNLIIIPAMTVVMGLGILCLASGSVPVAVTGLVSGFAGGICHLILTGFEWLCRISLRLPLSNWVTGRPENYQLVIYVAAILFLYIAHNYGVKMAKTGIHIGLSQSIRLITVLVAVVCVSNVPYKGSLMTFIDVGQGDSIYIQSDGGERFLVDGGSSSESETAKYTLTPYLKYMGTSRLDAVFLTHLDSDHISGILEILGDTDNISYGIDIGRICISDAVIEDETYESLVSLCSAKNIPIYRLRTGDVVGSTQNKDKGYSFEVLHPVEGYTPASKNDYSLVMKLTFYCKNGNNVTSLLTGDVSEDGESAVADLLAKMSDKGSIDIYKAAHHGSKYSNTAKLLATANPQLAVISCGEGNSYGHPHAEALENFRNVGSKILVTKDTGAITINIKNNGKYIVETYLD